MLLFNLLVCRNYIQHTVYQQRIQHISILIIWKICQILMVYQVLKVNQIFFLLVESWLNNHTWKIIQSQKVALKTRWFSSRENVGIRWGESEERVGTETNVWGTGERWWKGGQVRTRDGWTSVSQNNKENEGGVLQAEERKRRKGKCWGTNVDEIRWIGMGHMKSRENLF